jgi:hypothetical protein
MPHLDRARSLALAAAALLLTAATLGATAVFSADRPGANLAPVGDAASMVEIFQGSRTVLWTALSGSVASYQVEGWPVTIDGNDLGGALVIEGTGDSTAGLIDFGEKPMTIRFELN